MKFKNVLIASDFDGTLKNDEGIITPDVIEKIQYFIEFHGEQHYLARGTIFTEEKVATIQIRDKEKEEYCKQNNIPLVIIPYTKFNDLCLEDLLIIK